MFIQETDLPLTVTKGNEFLAQNPYLNWRAVRFGDLLG
jgi:hypothetical protein